MTESIPMPKEPRDGFIPLPPSKAPQPKKECN
jgi:hypothetical protein